MNIKDVAHKFIIYVFSQDADLGSQIKHLTSNDGYDSYFFSDLDVLYNRVKQNHPHLIVVDHPALAVPLAKFFENVLSVSSETQIICLAEQANLDKLTPFLEYNLKFYFDRSGKTCAEQVLLAINLICENLYRIFQNEQIYSMYKNTDLELKDLKLKNEEASKSASPRPFQDRIADYRLADSKEEVVQLFFKQTPMQSWMFLKYIPSISTYVSVSNQNMPVDWVEGVSFKIPSKESDFNKNLIMGLYPASLVNYLKQKWQVDHLKMMPLVLKDDVEGIFVTPQEIEASVSEDFSLMTMAYNLLILKNQPMQLDVEDSLTGVYNQIFYKRILEKEMDRSKRTFVPLSLIKISIDLYKELEVSEGRVFCDEILKKVAQVIKDTSRLPDYVCRTNENEFSIILTNCNRKGAAIRAERLRQNLKTASFSKVGFVLTVSQGISEYPTLTLNQDELSLSAQKALQFIQKKGGDKICIYKAPEGHKPDFNVSM